MRSIIYNQEELRDFRSQAYSWPAPETGASGRACWSHLMRIQRQSLYHCKLRFSITYLIFQNASFKKFQSLSLFLSALVPSVATRGRSSRGLRARRSTRRSLRCRGSRRQCSSGRAGVHFASRRTQLSPGASSKAQPLFTFHPRRRSSPHWPHSPIPHTRAFGSQGKSYGVDAARRGGWRSVERAHAMIAAGSDLVSMVRRCLLTFKPFR